MWRKLKTVTTSALTRSASLGRPTLIHAYGLEPQLLTTLMLLIEPLQSHASVCARVLRACARCEPRYAHIMHLCTSAYAPRSLDSPLAFCTSYSTGNRCCRLQASGFTLRSLALHSVVGLARGCIHAQACDAAFHLSSVGHN